MLRDAASVEVIDALLSDMPGVQRNLHVPDVDGVISVILDVDEQAEPVEQRIIAHLREKCPSAQFHVARGTDDGLPDEATYRRVFHRQIMPNVHAGTAPVSLAPVSEIPTAMRCRQTGGDLSIGYQAISDAERHSVGLDVLARITQADWRTSEARAAARRKQALIKTALSLEDELAARIGFKEAEAFKSEVRDFEELADLGPPRKRNHLATVFIDGNRIGELIDNCPDDDLRSLSSALDSATWTALTQATIAVCELTGTGPSATTEESRRLPVLPHIVGGDDVLVTMPAFSGVEFTRCFLRVFSAECSRLTGKSLGDVSASAGIVIHHRKYPFTRAADHANDVLATAKKSTEGRSASLALAELTRDSTNVIDHDMAWQLSDLEVNVNLLEAMSRWTNSARSTLEQSVASAVDRYRSIRQTLTVGADVSESELKSYDEAIWVAASSVLLTLRRGDGLTGAPEVIERIIQAAAGGQRSKVELELLFIARSLSVSRWWLAEERVQ